MGSFTGCYFFPPCPSSPVEFSSLFGFIETKKGVKCEKRALSLAGGICHSNTNHTCMHTCTYTYKTTQMNACDVRLQSFFIQIYNVFIRRHKSSLSISTFLSSFGSCVLSHLNRLQRWFCTNEWMNLIGTCEQSTCTIQDKRQKSNNIIETCPGVEAYVYWIWSLLHQVDLIINLPSYLSLILDDSNWFFLSEYKCKSLGVCEQQRWERLLSRL